MHRLIERAHPRTDAVLAQTLRDAGIVGAGGAGFPTYVKYAKPTSILLCNGAESEPGYYTDKLLFQEHAQAFARLFVFLKDIEAYEHILVGAEEGARKYLGELERLADSTGAFDVAYFENIYKYGQERALIKRLLDIVVPKHAIPPDVGVTVNNNETLWNVHRAIFEGHPTITKFVNVYGETPHHLCVEAPIGTLATDLLEMAGVAPGDRDECHLYDGGPVLCEEIADWTKAPYGVRKTTNGLLLVAPERLKTRAKSYPRANGPPIPDRITNVTDDIRRVHIPLGGAFGQPAEPTVGPGEQVTAGNLIAKAVTQALSVPVHASIDGTVTGVTATHIDIAQEDRA